MSDLYEDLAGALSKARVAVEASSAGLRVAAGEIYPQPDLLAACRKAGVAATLGLDSHNPQHVGYAFPQLVDALRQAGYTDYVRFQERKRTFFPIPAVSNKPVLQNTPGLMARSSPRAPKSPPV